MPGLSLPIKRFRIGKGGGIKFVFGRFFERYRLPDELHWMDGRQVFFRPESRPSNVLRRDIIASEAEQDALTHAYVASTVARLALTREQLEAEILRYQEQEQREQNQ